MLSGFSAVSEYSLYVEPQISACTMQRHLQFYQYNLNIYSGATYNYSAAPYITVCFLVSVQWLSIAYV